MITTRIQVKEHLAEYARAKYGVEDYVQFPHKLDIYHTIWDHMVKRPDDVGIDEGNLNVALPNRIEGKNPKTYNYLGERSVAIIQKRLETMFFAELRALFDENHHTEGIYFEDTAHEFMCKYGIESLTSDALVKDYYRYRNNVLRRKKTVRKYRKRETKKF